MCGSDTGVGSLTPRLIPKRNFEIGLKRYCGVDGVRLLSKTFIDRNSTVNRTDPHVDVS